MWCGHDLPPDLFWHQTRRTFAAAIAGKIDALQRQRERDLTLAWDIANFMNAGPKLKSLSTYLNQIRPRQPMSTDDIVASFRAMQGRGVKMNIRRVPS